MVNLELNEPNSELESDLRAVKGSVRPICIDLDPARYLMLRREGSGEQTKLTVSFQGYGQKKLVEKYASLEKD